MRLKCPKPIYESVKDLNKRRLIIGAYLQKLLSVVFIPYILPDKLSNKIR